MVICKVAISLTVDQYESYRSASRECTVVFTDQSDSGMLTAEDAIGKLISLIAKGTGVTVK
jgi:hypothetical protein